MWPGVLIGEKLSLNSLAKDFNNLAVMNSLHGFENQKTPGIQAKRIITLNQFILRFNHKTLGSKIENRFPIT